jgi:transposase
MEWTKISLSEADLKEIENAEGQIQKFQLLKRLQCIKLKHEGWKHRKLAKFFSITIETVSHWLKAYSQGGINDLLQWSYKGRVSIINLEQQEILKRRNNDKPFNTAKEAQNFIKENFDIDFHLHWVQKLLKKNFSFHSKK